MIKKLLIALSISFVLLIIAVYATLYFYKQPLLSALDEKMNENIQGSIYFDHDKTSLSLLRNFPDLTLRLGDFGVVNAEPFLGDTLLAIDAFDLSIDWIAALSEDYRITRIYLKNPRIRIKVLDNGQANYDIAMPSKDTTDIPSEVPAEQDTTSSELNLYIKKWKIENADVHYEDHTEQILAHIQGLTHEGSGNISLEQFDLHADTRIQDIYLKHQHTTYASHLSIASSVTLAVDNTNASYTLKENTWKINDFGFSLIGQVTMQEAAIDTDITIATDKNDFKSLLSLVPKAYIKDYENLITEGQFQFEGKVKGQYTEEKLPPFSLLVNIENAALSYPDLPQKLEHIDIDLRVTNLDGIIDNTHIQVSRLHADMGDNRIEGQIEVKNLRNYDHTATFDASLNIEEVSALAPLEDIILKGLCKIHLQSSGIYDSLSATIPIMDIAIDLSEGYAQHKDYPIPIENMALHASIKNSSGRMQDTKIAMEPCEMWIDNEKIEAKLFAENLDNITWDLSLLGKVDMETLTKVFPLEGASIKGALDINLRSKGSMDKVEQERYDQMYIQGQVTLQDFAYHSPDLPQPLSIQNALLHISTQALRLQNLRGAFGNAALSLSGSIENYIPYAIKDHAILQAYLKLQSPRIQVSEWMTYEEGGEQDGEQGGEQAPKTPAPQNKGAAASEDVVSIPDNLNIRFDTDIQELLYEGLTLQDLQGRVSVKNGVLALENVKFKLFEGLFSLRGSYATPPRGLPRYDVTFDATKVSIQQAYQSADIVKKLAPIAKHAEGHLSMNFALKGQLDKTLEPVLPSIYGKGSLLLQNTKVQGGPLWDALAKHTGGGRNNQALYLDNVRIQTEIKDGRLYVAPFTIQQGEYTVTTQGSNGLDGSIDYTTQVLAPTQVVAQQANIAVPENILSYLPKNTTLGIRTTGTYQNPKVSLDKNASQELKEEVRKAAKKEAEKKVKQEAKKQLKKNEKKLKKEGKKVLKGFLKKKKKD